MTSLEELKKRLYVKKEDFSERASPPDISQKDFKKEKFESEAMETSIRKLNLSKLMGSKIFWAVNGIVVLLLVFLFFSSVFNFQNIDLKIEGEKEIKSGQKISWKVMATNHNKKDIDDASLVFSVLDSLSSGGASIFRDRVSIGKIESGASVLREFETTVFGGRGKNLEARVVLEYKPESSSSFFAEEKFFSFIIAQSPVTVSFSMPDEARVGDEIKIGMRYFSQSEEKLENLFLKVDYPTGFEYKTSSKKPVENNKLWEVGALNPGEEGSFEISGIVKDSPSSVLNFGVSIGKRSEDDFLSFDEASQALVLRLSYLGVDILPKGDREEYIASLGEEIPVLVEWKNNLPETVDDASIEVFLDGDSIDLNSVRAREGTFISKDKKIIWNPSSYKDFASISPGDSGFLSFSFKVKRDISLANTEKNPSFRLKAVFKPGKKVSGFEDANVLGESEEQITISSAIQFSQKGFYFDSAIPNTGPLPPKAGVETTYTISWSLANPLNDIKNLVVKSTLPPYANFKEIFVPSSANVIFDKNTGVLEWRVGLLEAGTGFIKPALSLSFQVGMIPSVTHIGASPAIISQAEVSGIDSFSQNLNVLSSKRFRFAHL